MEDIWRVDPVINAPAYGTLAQGVRLSPLQGTFKTNAKISPSLLS